MSQSILLNQLAELEPAEWEDEDEEAGEYDNEDPTLWEDEDEDESEEVAVVPPVNGGPPPARLETLGALAKARRILAQEGRLLCPSAGGV